MIDQNKIVTKLNAVLKYGLLAFIFFTGVGRVKLILPEVELSFGGNTERFLFALLLLWLISKLTSNESLRALVGNHLLLISGIALIFSASLLSFTPWANLQELTLYIAGFLLFLLVIEQTSVERTNHYLLAVFFISAVVMVLTGFKNSFVQDGFIYGNYSALRTPLGDGSFAALYFISSLPAGLYLTLRCEGVKRIFMGVGLALVYLIALLILDFVVLFTGFVAAGIFFTLQRPPFQTRFIAVGLFLCVTILFHLVFFSGIVSLQSPWFTLNQFVSGFSTRITDEITVIAAIWREYPLSGLGCSPEALSLLLVKYIPSGSVVEPHNLVSYFLICFGVPGLFSLITLCFLFMRSLSNSMSLTDKSMGVACFIAFLAGSMAINPFMSSKLTVIFWFLAGISYSADHKD